MCENCKISGYFWQDPGHKQRLTRKDTQNVLLNHETLIVGGRLRFVKSRHIGAGVYEIYLQGVNQTSWERSALERAQQGE
jgi:hypothetical protein